MAEASGDFFSSKLSAELGFVHIHGITGMTEQADHR